MKRRILVLVALVLAAAVALCGCGAYLSELAAQLGYYETIHSDDFVYTRPDMAALQQQVEESCRLAAEAEDVEAVVEGIYAFYDVYEDFGTNYSLANIYYSCDLRDTYWEQEYTYCAENAAIADGALDQLFYALAASPHRQALESEEYFGAGYFDAFEGESIWDETFTALMEQEAQLCNRYYELSEQAAAVEFGSEEYFTTYGTQMAQIYVELIALRQQQAAYAGYDSYSQFAYEFYHGREFAPEAAESYMQEISRLLVPLYRQVNESDAWDVLYDYCSEAQTFRYVQELAERMGGDVQDAFSILEDAELYDIGYGANKYNASFEVWLSSYAEPFIFMSPTGTPADQLTFAHEFGHFVNDYLCYGSSAGTDVAEVHSQGMEYLSLCDADPALVRYKLADCLCVYVEQTAYALFEHQVYSLEGDELTVENVQALYEDIGGQFGFDSWAWDSRDYVTVTHFYTNPMYLISYVVSNDAALQLYQLEQQKAGDGVAVYKQCLYSGASDLGSFVGTYGLEDPMAKGRLESVLQTLETILN